jgi:hypothetical protein
MAYKLTNRDKRVINKAGGADHSSIEYGYSPPVIGNYEKNESRIIQGVRGTDQWLAVNSAHF